MLKLLGELIVPFALILSLMSMFLVIVLIALWLFRKAPSLLTQLRVAYLIRIPILTILGIWFFCIAALLLPGTRSLLGNAFDLIGDDVDVGPEPTIGLGTSLYFAIKLAFVSFAACLLGATAMVTRHLVRLYGQERFSMFTESSVGSSSVAIDPDIEHKHLRFYLLVIAGPVLFSAFYKSIVSSTLQETPLFDVAIALASGLVATCLGVALSRVVLWSTSLIQRRYTRRFLAHPLDGTVSGARDIVGYSPDIFYPKKRTGSDPLFIDQARTHNPSPRQVRWAARLARFIERLLPPDARPGYIARTDYQEVLILPGHIAAGIWLLATLAIYIAIGLAMYLLAYRTHVVPFSLVPALCYLLLLAMLLCWGLSSLAFFFDRFRIPVLIPLVGLLLIASVLGPDYSYPTVSETTDAGAGETEAQSKLEPSSDTMIVVAANGGGIQASAWTARVLTGLEEDCQSDPACDQDFGQSIRLISSVSGGSLGTMYFLNEYDEDGTLPENEKVLEDVVARAEGSSLDYIAWGLLYPDLVHTVDPLPWPLPWKPLLGPFGLDRGQTLDRAWLRTDMEKWPNRKRIEQGLSQWQADAKAGIRPGVIFNTTIVETGQRLPLSTVPLPEDSPGGIRYKELFEDIQPGQTIPIVTAARLSASFPYVSPAARAAVESKAKSPQENEPYENHLVDGGYYDNYGMSSLVEWLDWKLEDDHTIKKVIVIQIISSPEVKQSHSACLEENETESDNSITHLLEGLQERPLFQMIAPAKTAFNVRGAGQSTHSEVELQLLMDKYEHGHDLKILRIPFRFAGKEPPLSWHLTRKDKREIQCAWNNSMDARKEVVEETKRRN